MNWSDVKHLTVSGKNAVRMELGGEVVWKGLPEGYARLDYIKTTGTQWINTGFVPDQDSRVVCEFVRTGGDGIWGTRYTTGARNFNLRGISNNFQAGYNDKLLGTGVPLDNEWHTVDQNKNICSLDGVVVAEFEYAKFNAPEDNPIAIGGINANNKFYYGLGRYRGCQIYDNGKLIRDFIPCKNPSGEAGMYDTVEAKFYGNSGTGTFEYA